MLKAYENNGRVGRTEGGENGMKEIVKTNIEGPVCVTICMNLRHENAQSNTRALALLQRN